MAESSPPDNPVVVRGKDGSPVAGELWVMRIGERVVVNQVAKESRKAPEGMFILTSEDKASAVPRLSVYVEVLTIADQIWAILGGKPKYTVVACGRVGDITGIETFDDVARQSIRHEVHWDPAESTLPGAEGHCGISNLHHSNKSRRKQLRSKLADVFQLSPVPVPSDFGDELVTSEMAKSTSKTGDPVKDRVAAIRRLRRERAQILRASGATHH